jgi:zinc protease
MTLVALATALVLAAPPAAPAKTPAAGARAAKSTPVAAAPSIDTPKIAFQRFVLPNGLVLIVHEDPKAPIVAVNVWYHVGSKNGFAHLFEHLMFNGSEHFNDDWFKVLERIGGTDLNGTTNRDRTNYFQNVPTPALDTVLWMESDRMGHLLGAVTQARLDEQRGVVKNEKRQGENQPYGRAWEAISAGSFPAGHPYSWTTIGSMQDLDAATLDDVKSWFKDWYGAANAVIVVAGDVKADDVRARVEKYFGNIASGPPLTRQEAWIAKRTGEHRQAMADRVPQSRVYLVWNTPSGSSPESDDLDLAARILSSGKSSRLYKRLVYDGQIATDTSAMQMSGEIAGAGGGGDHDHRHRPPRRGPGAGRGGRSRGAFPLPREGAHPGRARPGANGNARRLHPRRRAHRGLRRQVGRAGPRRGLRRPARLLRGAARARPERHPGPRPGRCPELAVGRRVRARDHSLEGRQGLGR